MFKHGFIGGLITMFLGFILPFCFPQLGDLFTDILLFVGLNPRCGATEALAALVTTFFIVGFVIGAIVFLIKRVLSGI